MTKHAKVLGYVIAAAAVTTSSIPAIISPETAAADTGAESGFSAVVGQARSRLCDFYSLEDELAKEGHVYQIKDASGRVLAFDGQGNTCFIRNALVPSALWSFEKTPSGSGVILSCQAGGVLCVDAAGLHRANIASVPDGGDGEHDRQDGRSGELVPDSALKLASSSWHAIRSGEGVVLYSMAGGLSCLQAASQDEAPDSVPASLPAYGPVGQDAPKVSLYDVGNMLFELKNRSLAMAAELPFAEASIQAENGGYLTSDGGEYSTNRRTRAATWNVARRDDGLYTISCVKDGSVLALNADYWNAPEVHLVEPAQAASMDRKLTGWFAEALEGTERVRLASTVWENMYLSDEGGALLTRPLGQEGASQTWLFEDNSGLVAQEEGSVRMAEIAVAEAESGEHKGGEKYWSLFTSKYEAWCSEFGGWCLHEAGLELGVTMPAKISAATDILKFYEAHPEYAEVRSAKGDARPHPGDICLYNGKSGKPEHTNVCVAVSDDGFTAVSGNSGDKVKKVEKDFGFSGYYVTVNWEAALADSYR